MGQTGQQGPQIGLLGATFRTGNMGVGALTAGAITSILHRWPDAEIFLIDYGDGPTEYPWADGKTIHAINIRFSKKLFLPNNIALLIALAALRRRNETLAKIDACTLIASIAGGDSFSDIYGMQRLLYVALPQVLALLLKKTVVQLPQTYGPFRGGFARCIARWILQRSHKVYARDPASLRHARELTGESEQSRRLELRPDVAFALEPRRPTAFDVESLCKPVPDTWLAGFNVSGLLHMGGYSGKNMFGLREDYPSLVRAVLDLLIRKLNATVLLVPHVFGAGDESDLAVCLAIQKECAAQYGDRVRTVPVPCDQHEIKSVIGTCEILVGSRMHACIAALSQGIPAVGLAYSRKFGGVFGTVGMEKLVVDLGSASIPEVLNAVTRMADDRVSLRRELASSVPNVRRQALELFAGESGL